MRRIEKTKTKVATALCLVEGCHIRVLKHLAFRARNVLAKSSSFVAIIAPQKGDSRIAKVLSNSTVASESIWNDLRESFAARTYPARRVIMPMMDLPSLASAKFEVISSITNDAVHLHQSWPFDVIVLYSVRPGQARQARQWGGETWK